MSDTEFAEQAYELLEVAAKVRDKHPITFTEAVNVVLASRHKDEEAIMAYAALYFSTKKRETPPLSPNNIYDNVNQTINPLPFGGPLAVQELADRNLRNNIGALGGLVGQKEREESFMDKILGRK